MQREDQADHGNGPGTNSSESAVNHLSKSVVRDTEGAAKQKPHATFCGNRGRATAPGDPVVGVQFPCATRLMLPAVATAIPGHDRKSYGRRCRRRYEESDGCIVPMKPRTMPADSGGGDRGGKAAGRRKGKFQRMPRTQRRNRHVTDG